MGEPPARRNFERWSQRLALLAVANFLAFVAADVCLGGDALNGMTTGGRYYLSQNGRLTEVSHATWIYSRAHAISNVVMIPLAIASRIATNLIPRSPTDVERLSS